MSLCIRRITLNNFRKFREPITINGLTDGLNIVIEPNETGKSTVLDALRAAFFVRHATKNQLASSYAPHGESVAPEVEVAFDIDQHGWTITKRFLRTPAIEVRGPGERAQGDAAEERLQQLLGFTRDNSRTGDPNAYGALGFLWVAQTEALSVAPPGQIVRDTVHSTLEAEVGSIMGGAAFERVRSRIDKQFSEFWTATGRVGGRQTAAKERAEAAELKAREASTKLAALEKSLAEIDEARARLKVLEKDAADDTDIKAREDLVNSMETARSAALLLSTSRAEYTAASAKVQALEDLQSRHDNAVKYRDEAQNSLQSARANRAEIAADLAHARAAASQAREALAAARLLRQQAKEELAAGETRLSLFRKRAALAAARKRYDGLLDFETQLEVAKKLHAQQIPASVMTELEENDRSVAVARAELAAGATRIELVGAADFVTLDGHPLGDGERALTTETRLSLGGAAELIIRPPAASGSAQARLEDAIARQASALAELGVPDTSSARVRNEAALEAAGEIRTLTAKIEAITPADPEINLVAGVEALKLLIAGAPEIEGEDGEAPDIGDLKATLEDAESAFARAEGVQESAIDELGRIEELDKPLAADEAGAASDLQNAVQQIETIEAKPEFADLASTLDRARKEAADAAVKLAEAERNATAYDVEEIERKIRVIDARSAATSVAKRQLETEIARLEGTIESEGGKGLAERAAFAIEEAEAARIDLERVSREAETLKLLRAVLDEARAEMSRSYVGPVARRAKRHIERLLPGCELTFTEDLGLESVTRGGFAEECAHLSRGTQEQLAVLTRLAFADMLLEEGRPVSLILDDPLVYSDDARLDLMTEILLDAAKRMQVILLTCRDRAFRHVQGQRILLS